jgi:hypothetical protein
MSEMALTAEQLRDRNDPCHVFAGYTALAVAVAALLLKRRDA